MSEYTKDDELGALWEKEGPKGPYMTGSVTVDGKKTDIVVFRNHFRTKDNHPAFRILRSRPKEERTSTRRDEQQYQRPQEAEPWQPATRRQAVPRPAPRPAQRRQEGNWADEVPHPAEIDDDDGVPF
jgi:hypothetical protein